MTYYHPEPQITIKIMKDNSYENLWRVEGVFVEDGMQTVSVRYLSFRGVFDLITDLPNLGFYEYNRVGDISMKPIM